MTTATVSRGARVLSRVRLPRLTIRRVGALAALVVILLAAWLFLRSSSLVAIKRVRVTGLSGADAAQIRSALTGEVLTMTTLDVSSAKLAAAVADYPHIARIRVATHFPHGVTIAVTQTTPVATITSGGTQVAVDGQGQLLPHGATAGLPSLTLASDPSTSQVSAAGTRAVLSVLAAAPYQLLGHIANARSSREHGIAVQLRSGPVLYFGDTTQLGAKWAAADAVLASANSAGAAYIDISAPARPAAGPG